LADAETFNYLNQSGNVRIEGVDDAADFREVQESMDGLQFTQAEKHSIFTIVAWILHVGNLVFKPAGDKKCEVEGGTGAGSTLSFIAKLMEVSPDALLKSITNRVMVVRGQAPMDISLSVTEAEAARDALSKHTFSRLFDWLVERINKSIGIGAGQKGRSIGILDIFGFEIFELNSFEQLCINFANEKLQQVSSRTDIQCCSWKAERRARGCLTRIGACGCVSFIFFSVSLLLQFFNFYTFKLEETVYAQEKIDFKHVSYIDNQPVLDLIEMKPKVTPTRRSSSRAEQLGGSAVRCGNRVAHSCRASSFLCLQSVAGYLSDD
jgi:myosin heavy subunit